MKKRGFSNNLKLSIPVAAEKSITKFLTQSGTFKDGDLRVNKDGVRIVSQSEPEVLPPIKPADDELSLSDLDMVKFIGKGSSGVVQLVQHKWTGQFFALKVIQLNIDEATRKAIAQELKITQSSQCPYLVTSYQSFYDNGAISLILEYMDGGSLADFLKSVKSIPESYLSAIFKQVLRGLIYLHHDRHIIHRDLKPSNLLINHRGEVKITGFGVSTIMTNTAGLANTFVGTYNYMSPERIVGNKYDNRSDIWSLGLVVLECATGKFPYLPPDQEETWSSVFELMEAIVEGPPPALPSENFSLELSSFISTCLQKDPDSRSSAKELMEHPFLNKYNNSEINLASYFTDAGSPLATPGNLSAAVKKKQKEELKNSMDKAEILLTSFNGDAAPNSDGYVLPDPRSVKKLKEVETPIQLRLPEHSIKGFVPILVISCADNQDSEETYFISYIVGELFLRGFTPIRYNITRSTVTGNQELLYRSQIRIMIFSMNYARSRGCRDQLVAILDHLKPNNLNNLITVFFKVNRSKLRLQSGSFGRAFSRLGKSVQASQVLKWREAMIELTSINRYQYMKGNEVMLAKNIVRDVCSLLNSETNRNLKGTSLQLKSILSLLHCSQSSAPYIVGLWGMAGIGKTTITREIFRRQAQRYEVCYFLPDFHLMCQTKGLSHLRDEFFSKIFGVEKVFIDACDTKLGFTRDRFLNKRVLIVLDGVSDARDAEILLGGFSWFSGGHKIILTSRNRQVLVQCNAKEIYKIQKLSEPESLSLCCQFATKQKGRMSLISELVSYASGIPLALRVLGSSVQKKCLDNEKQHLRRLRQHPPIDIQDAFRSSFNGLDDNEKNMFLDLACFFRGENKDRVVNILDGCGLFTDLGIYALIDESLVTLVDNMIEMPNIFQDTGRYVVCQENNEAGKRSRLWDANDIVDVLTNNSGTEAIEGIFLDASDLTFELNPAVFEKMYRLRLLKLHCPTSVNHYNVCLPQGLHSLPDELRLLHWERYPLGSLPRNFNPKNLVELNMPYSNLTKLWKGTKNLEKLKRIILSHSRQLTKFPRLSKARNLEHIDLEGCTSLVKVNSSILHHHKLTFLSLKDCSHLRIMPTTAHLESLEVLNLSGCSELEDLQDFSPNLKELYLAGTAIIEMPSSIGDLTRLVKLDLENCERLHHLPPGISNLKAMVTLNLSGCSNLKSLPDLDALFLQDSQRLNTRITMESVSLNRHSAIQESRLDGSETLLNLDNLQLRSVIHDSCFSRDAVEEFLPAFEYPSRNRIPQESWPRVTIPVPSSILHSLASRLYAVVSLFLCNAYLVDVPEELCLLASVMTLDLRGNSFSEIPNSIKELCKLHSLSLRHCKNLKSLPELPRSLVILNAHGCVSLESFPSSFEQFPRHYTFSNCFKLSPKVVRKYIGKALDSVEGMAKGLLQEHINAPAFSICIPASASHQSSVNFQAGSSVMVELTPGMLKRLSGFALSVVVEFWDNYSNAAGFGIKCICRKTRTDLSPRSERIFHCWGPKQPTTVQRDHMFVFGCVKMHHAEAISHDFLDDLVTFEFHPVNWENQLLNDSCTVKRCGVYFITAANDSCTKRPSSSMDPGGLSSVDHMAPTYKRCRLKGVIETVVLSLRKRKRDMSVSTVKNRSNSEFGESEFGVSVKPRRSYSDGSKKPRGSYSDGSVRDAAIRIQTDFRGYKCRKQHLITRQGIVLIQARWRGYKVRKSYRDLILSMEY